VGLIKKSFVFLVLGLLINSVLYYVADKALVAQDFNTAIPLVFTLTINTFIYFVGCLMISFNVVKEIRKGKDE